MPLIKRSVEPVNVSRAIVPTQVRNELEFVSNSTLSNLILQLSSLSKHAEDIFGELHRETCCVLYRSGQLDDRIDRLKQKILQLNPTVEEVSLQDINMRKPFKSSIIKDQQIVSLGSRSQAIVEKYNECEPPPALHKLDPYREDGKQSMKFYTDPGYFFDLWCEEMKMDAETNLKKQKNRNRRVRPSKEPRTIREPRTHLDEYREKRHGPEFVDKLRHERPEYQTVGEGDYQSNGGDSRGGSLHRPSSLEIQKLSQTAQAYALTGQGIRASEYGYIFNNGPLAARQNSVKDQSGRRAYTQQQIDRQSGAYSPEYRELPENERFSYSPEQRSGGQGNRPVMPPPSPPITSPTPSQGGSTRMLARDTLPPPPPAPVGVSAGYSQGGSRGGARNSSELPPPPSPPASPSGQFVPTRQAPPVPPPSFVDNLSVLPPPPPNLPPPTGSINDGSRLVHHGASTDAQIMHVVDGPELVRLTKKQDREGGVGVDMEVAGAPSPSRGGGGDEKPFVRDTRCDLLSAIREGLQLRKVEERRLQTERKHQTSGRLDVQSIMEAAFEMRRKALESNDSDKEDDCDEDDGNWSDDG